MNQNILPPLNNTKLLVNQVMTVSTTTLLMLSEDWSTANPIEAAYRNKKLVLLIKNMGAITTLDLLRGVQDQDGVCTFTYIDVVNENTVVGPAVPAISSTLKGELIGNGSSAPLYFYLNEDECFFIEASASSQVLIQVYEVI